MAHEATLASVYARFLDMSEGGDISSYNAALRSLSYDILSNSWGESTFFPNVGSMEKYREAIQDEVFALTNGRDGKGSVVLFSAGNSNYAGVDAALDASECHPYSISVGAVDLNGRPAGYSTPGSRLLVATPSRTYERDLVTNESVRTGEIVTTDRQGEEGYNTAPSPKGDDAFDFGGTSAACPEAAGVVALMLEANPELGYRDVSDILALSARNTDPTDPMWVENGGHNWNGGGLSHHRQVGYGLVDATAAVRLAETWTAQSTEANKVTLSRYADVNAPLPDGGDRFVTSGVVVDENIQVEQATVFINLDHKHGADVVVRLISPSGTVSTLLDDRGTGPTDKAIPMKDINIMTSLAFLGEDSRGEWRLEVVDKITNLKYGTLNNWTMELHGKAETADDTYIYTADFARLATENPERTTLRDAEGFNVINTAAVSTDVYMDLRAGQNSQINGAHLTLAEGTAIHGLFTGDGNDVVTTNSLNNSINTGRGNDTIIISGKGHNVINGETGLNTAQFLGNRAGYDVQLVEGHYVVVGQDSLNELYNVQALHFADQVVQMDFMTQFA